MRQRTLLLGAAALAVVLAVRPTSAFTDAYWLEAILVFLETYMTPVLEAMDPPPPTLDGGVLAGTASRRTCTPGAGAPGATGPACGRGRREPSSCRSSRWACSPAASTSRTGSPGSCAWTPGGTWS